MRLRHIITTFVLYLACAAASAAPARYSVIYLTQPDGTVFQARMKGDEFTRIKTDASGHAIIQDSEGWWHYAIYNADGTKSSSGWKVGSRATSDILSASRNIPYGRLAEKAQERRRLDNSYRGKPALRQMREQEGIPARSGETDLSIVKHGLIILANFKDVDFQYTKEDFERLLTEHGYSVNGATGSAKDYFDEQFQGQLEFDFHVSDIVTLSKDRAHYGENDNDGNDKAPADMIAEACILADAETDFSLYDDDGDGKVDNIFLFFAGEDEAEGADEECIWSHAWYVRSGAGIKLELDGTIIDRYACASELTIQYYANGKKDIFISGIGTFCHEYSHTLGLPDFYDTDYEESGGISAGLWTRTSLMDGGNYNNNGNSPPYYNALERIIAGISEPAVLEKTGTYTLEPIHRNGASYMLKTDNEDEFFLFECREYHNWDKYIGGTGLLAYHINLSSGGFDKWLDYNQVNTDPEFQKADLMEADGRADSFVSMDDYAAARSRIAGIFYPYEGHDTISAETSPGLTYKDGGYSECVIGSIRKEGDGSSVRFNFIGKDNISTPPAAVNIEKDVFADAAIIRFESSHPYEGPAHVSWGRAGKEMEEMTVLPYSPGKYAIILEGLESGGKTYEIEICFITDGLEGEIQRTAVMTKRMPVTEWPYIYLGSMERNSDGTFPKGTRSPLRVYGAAGASEIRWKFDGNEIRHEGDGYYTINQSGILQAEIYWEDGSIDKVMKRITVSL